MNDISVYKTLFKKYVSGFYGNDEYVNGNVKIKEEHTLRVYKNITSLAKSLNLAERDNTLSGIIALFHDIGRFEQLRKYKTFNDKLSEDHADLGLKIIEKENFFKGLSSEEQIICKEAIRYHNKKDLFLDSNNNRIILFSKLIRDADKMDILSVLANYYKSGKSNNPALVLDLPEGEGFSKSVLETFFEKRKLDSKKIETQNDFILLLMSWSFDLNFKYTKTKILNAGYYDKILKTIPNDENKKRIELILWNELNRKF